MFDSELGDNDPSISRSGSVQCASYYDGLDFADDCELAPSARSTLQKSSSFGSRSVDPGGSTTGFCRRTLAR